MAYTLEEIEELEEIRGKIYARNYSEGVKKIKKNFNDMQKGSPMGLMPNDMTEEELNEITFTIPEATYSFDENGDIIMI
jgi:uncharacterized protein with ParB-like and HNH nuclease domain